MHAHKSSQQFARITFVKTTIIYVGVYMYMCMYVLTAYMKLSNYPFTYVCCGMLAGVAMAATYMYIPL